MALGRCVPVMVLAVFGLDETAADVDAAAQLLGEGFKGG
jgi:hypothetical protein